MSMRRGIAKTNRNREKVLMFDHCQKDVHCKTPEHREKKFSQ